MRIMRLVLQCSLAKIKGKLSLKISFWNFNFMQSKGRLLNEHYIQDVPESICHTSHERSVR
jgi:hypothetical protein